MFQEAITSGFTRIAIAFMALLCPFFPACTKLSLLLPLFIFTSNHLSTFSVYRFFMSSFHLMTDSLPFFCLYCSSLYRSTSTASLIYFYSQSLSSSFLHILITLSILSWFCWYLTVSNSCFTAWSRTEIWLTIWGQIRLSKLLLKSFHGQIFKVNQKKMATINLQHLSAMFKPALFNWV